MNCCGLYLWNELLVCFYEMEHNPGQLLGGMRYGYVVRFTLPKNESTKYIVKQAAEYLLTISEVLGALQKEMLYLAE